MLRVEVTDAVATITLARPAARNALSMAMMTALHEALESVEDSIRCVVLAAEGPVFSAGHDLQELTAHRADPMAGAAFFADAMAACAALMQAVGAPAAAGGRRGGGHRHRGRLPARRDLRPGRGVRGARGSARRASTSACSARRRRWRCPAPCARKPAMEMLLLGEMIAGRGGAAHRPGQPRGAGRPGAGGGDRPRAADRRRARRSRCGWASGASTRSSACRCRTPTSAAGAVMVENLLAEDAAEGIGAFLGKRKPVWRHR